MNRAIHRICDTETRGRLISPIVSYFIFYFFIMQTFDTSIFIWLILGLLFLIFGLYVTRKDNIPSNKYQRLDFMGWLVFYIPMMVLFLLDEFKYFQTEKYIWSISLISFVAFLFWALFCLWSWSINVHFRKQIDSDTAYRFWVSFFISWWIIIFYLIAESLRFYHFWG